jgi:hypothetical protein
MKWISVKDRLPEDDQTTLCWQANQTAAIPIICYFDKEVNAFVALFTWQEIFVDVIYWMPLPKPPEEIVWNG